MPLTRRGLALAELLVGVVLTGVLGTLTGRILATAALQLRDRSERMGAEHSLRVAANAARAMLESLAQDSVTGVDLLSTTATGFIARAFRAAGAVCAVSPGLFVTPSGPGWWNAVREPVDGRDSLLVGSLVDESWRVFGLNGPPRPGRCPDGAAALELPVNGDSAAVADLGFGSPLRVFEGVEFRRYSSAVDDWLGLRLVATAQAIQPFAGPLAAGGLSLSYVNRDGLPAGTPTEVAGVGFRVVALTERAGGLGLMRGSASRPDSVNGFVALGNPP
jgi:hypothetical protein